LNDTDETSEAAVVATVTLIATGVEPLTIADIGDTVHVEFAGAPEQVKFTVCANPAIGATLNPNVALCPALTVELDGVVTVVEKSGAAGG
jgi:hypothetical protein